jgi:hypothetical protein
MWIVLFICLLWLILKFILKNSAYYQFFSTTLEVKEKCSRNSGQGVKACIPERVYKPVYVFESQGTGPKRQRSENIGELIKKPESGTFKVINCTTAGYIHYDEERLVIGDKIISSEADEVLINNLDYDIGNVAVFKERVKLLEWLYQHKSISVTIITSFGLERFEEIYHELLTLNSADLKESKEIESAWYKWIFLMRKFRHRIEPIKLIGGDIKEDNRDKDLPHDFRQDEEINQELEKLFFSYRSIYNDLTFKERILLLDLAKDGIINIKNKYALNSLCKKGLLEVRPDTEKGSLHEKPILRIKRNSFKKYLSQLAEQGETRDIVDTIEKKGNWSSIKYLLIILIIGLVIFLGFIEQSIFDRFVALFGAAAVVIPLIFRLSQSFLFKQDTTT